MGQKGLRAYFIKQREPLNRQQIILTWMMGVMQVHHPSTLGHNPWTFPLGHFQKSPLDIINISLGHFRPDRLLRTQTADRC